MQLPPKAQRYPLLLLGAAGLLAVLVAISIGSADIGIGRAWSLLWWPDDGIDARIIHQLRLPRGLSAFAVGGLLGLAGALMQVLLRNPLGDPFILGISGGAAVAVLGAMLLGLPLAWQAPAAFSGALLSVLLVFVLARGRGWDITRLLLTGVVVAAGWSAMIAFILSLSPPVQLPGMLFWLMGDLSDADQPLLPWSVLLLGLAVALPLAQQLNLAAQGEMRAAALGVNLHRLHGWIYLLASLLTATAVTVAGSLGFVGLIAPHLVRLLGGSDHRFVLPGSVLLGGALLTLADTAARTLIAPMQLPVGVLTALLGVPMFLYLMHASRRRTA